MYLNFYEESKSMKYKIQNKVEIEDVLNTVIVNSLANIVANDPDLKKEIKYNKKKKEYRDKIIEKYGSEVDKEKHIFTPRRGIEFTIDDLYKRLEEW